MLVCVCAHVRALQGTECGEVVLRAQNEDFCA